MVQEAGELLLCKWPGGEGCNLELEQELKADGSLVTEADFASNEHILSALQQLFPEDSILSEEVPPEPGLSERERVWILDPLDGTSHFAKGMDDFSILLGLCEHHEISFGIMYFPAKKRFAIGERGKETTLNGKSLSVSTSEVLREQSVYIRNFEPDFGKVSAGVIQKEDLDSGMGFFKVCEGSLDGVIMRMTTHKEWDIAAPCAVLEGAGGRVSDEKGQPLRFNQGGASVNFRYIVASNGKTHEELLSLIPKE